MLTQAENEKLTRVGPGTPGGELLRRYWHPVYPAALLEKNPVAAVRILGEDLVLYRDRSGDLGLIAHRCPHRMVSFALGIPEEHGLRCLYHGWLFNGEGRCVEQPLEPPDSTFKDRVRIAGYPVQALGGLIWAYLGPLPAPLLPQWDLLVKPGVFRQIVAHRLPCNWLQVMENRGDLAHGTFLHGRFAQYALERQGRLTDDPKARYNAAMELHAATRERGDYRVYKPIYNRFGFTKGHRMASASEESRSWTIGNNPVIFPYMLGSGPGSTGIRNSYQWGVPVDDTTTWHMQYLCYDFPEDVGPPEQDTVPYVEVPLQDESGNYTIDYVMGQDMAAWHQQGEICDRTGEHLSTTDVCVIAYRKMLSEQIEIVANGGEPMNVFHDAAENYRLDLQIPGAHEHSQPVQGGNTVVYRGNFHKRSKGGWLYIDDDIDRYCPDRDTIVRLYEKTAALAETRPVLMSR
ncbi:MAG: Rieske 2Fe-2S domain-containing protein [Candidatus Lustribacter sp.]|jgi:5,5'-dehydrodivanillate O-demethylase